MPGKTRRPTSGAAGGLTASASAGRRASSKAQPSNSHVANNMDSGQQDDRPWFDLPQYNETEASTTAVDQSHLDIGFGEGSGASTNDAPSTMDRFWSFLERVDSACQGDATQSWGMQIWGMGSGEGSTATKASKDANIWGTFDYKAFMEDMGLVMTVMPGGTPGNFSSSLKGSSIKNPDKVAKFVFKVFKNKDKIVGVFGGGNVSAAKVDKLDPEIATWMGLGDTGSSSEQTEEQAPESDATGGEQEAAQGGDDMVEIVGVGLVPASKVVIVFETAVLREGAPTTGEADEEWREGSAIRTRLDARWARGCLHNGQKVYTRDGVRVSQNDVPHDLWKSPPFQWGDSRNTNRFCKDQTAVFKKEAPGSGDVERYEPTDGWNMPFEGYY